MKSTPSPRLFLGVALLVIATLGRLPAAGPAQESSITFSQPDQPTTLVIDLPRANLRFTSTESDAVHVNATAPNPDASPTVTLTEQANHVTLALTTDASAPDALPELLIRVPFATNLHVTIGTGQLQLDSLRGEVDVSLEQGSIQLTNLSGSIAVDSKAAAITASFAANPTKVIALTTEVGTIDVTLPADTRAAVTLRSHRGPIDTDFTAAKLKSRTVKARPDSATPAGKTVTGTLNGGNGAVLTLATISGRIALRQSAPVQGDPEETKDGVTVRFHEPDRFTDASEDFPGSTSDYYLAELREHIQRIGARRLGQEQRLVITLLDLDLAGHIRPDRRNLRFLTSTSMPRAHVRFQLLGADGQVLQEGERRLSTLNYQFNATPFGRDEPLYYDKQMFRDWLESEFRPPAKPDSCL